MFLIEEEQSNKSELRKSPRQEFRESIHFQFKNESDYGGCVGYDISRGGVRIRFEEFVPVDTEMIVQVKLGNGQIFDLNGRVAWVNQIPHSDRYQIGLEFTKDQPSEDAKRVFHRYFASSLF